MNAEDAKLFKDFKARMDRIARKNGDEFKVTMDVDETNYNIEVIETADRHTFLQASGPSVAAAINKAYAEIPECLAAWGYKDAI